MRIDQRENAAGVTLSSTSNDKKFVIDRMGVSTVGAPGGTFVGERVYNSSTSSKYALRGTMNTIPVTVSGTNSYRLLDYRVENLDIADLRGNHFTFSFKFKASQNGKYPVTFLTDNSGTNYYYSTQFNYSGSGSVQDFSITIELPDSVIDSASHLRFILASANEGNYVQAVKDSWSDWSAGLGLNFADDVKWWNVTGAYVEIADIQLERGTVSTPFETRPYGVELGLCQRYYLKLEGAHEWAGSTEVSSTTVYYPVHMCKVPTASFIGPTYLVGTGFALVSYSNFSLGASYYKCSIRKTASTSGVYVGFSGAIELDAEL